MDKAPPGGTGVGERVGSTLHCRDALHWSLDWPPGPCVWRASQGACAPHPNHLSPPGVLEEAEFYNIASLVRLVKERIRDNENRTSQVTGHLGAALSGSTILFHSRWGQGGFWGAEWEIASSQRVVGMA